MVTVYIEVAWCVNGSLLEQEDDLFGTNQNLAFDHLLGKTDKSIG